MATLSPLNCATCSKELEDPIYLDCSHLFCKACISGRSECPTCTRPIPSDFTFDVDPLTSFLIDTSHEAAESCANCERISQPMFFCETCQQSLCVGCKTETHEARMFARHRLVPLEERARVRGSVTCRAHSQPYVLWCGETRALVCIDCFRGRTIENGHSFVAIDQAHRTQLEKLQQWAERLQAFQEERREEASARERLIQEIYESAKTTRNDIWSVCQQVVDTVVAVREKLTRQLEEERRQKEKECREVIEECTGAVSTGSYCLLSTHILCSAASFIDFLQLNGELVKRIQNHLSTPTPRPPPTCSSTINTRSELAKSLESVLGLGRSIERGGKKKESGGYKGRSGSPVSVLSKYQMIVDLAGAFGSLMVQVEGPLREAGGEVTRLTRAVQERQRDITMRKLLLRREEIEGTVLSLESVRDRVRALIDRQKALRPEAQAMWEEELERVTRQQAIFRRKMEDASSLEEQADRALSVSRMLLPFAEGIERMTEVLDRKRLHPPDPAPMESICIQINTLSPDSRQRVQAIEKEEQLRLERETRRKEEADENTKQKTVQSLKHTKRRENRKSHRIVDDRRERSPGGTDVALLSPFYRHTSSITSEDSEIEAVTVGVDLLFESERARSGRERVGTVTTEDEDDEEGREGASKIVTEERRSAALRVNMRKESEKAERQQSELNVASRRHTVLSSLNRAIEDYGGGEGNLRASEVKRAERKRANTDVPADHERPLSAPLFPPMSISIDDRRATVSCSSRGGRGDTVAEPQSASASMTSLLSSPRTPSVVPAVPFVPQEVFDRANAVCSPDSGVKLGAFEMRERMLESLKGRVARYENGEEEEEEEEEREMRL